MLIHKSQLTTAAMFASKDASRLALNYLRLDPDGTVWATDGAIAVRIVRSPTDPTEYPAILRPEAKSPSVTVLLHRDLAERMAKAIKPAHHLPVLNYAIVGVTEKTLSIAWTDLEHPVVLTQQLADAQYPGVESIFNDPKPSQAESVGIGPDYLQRIGRAAKVADTEVVATTLRGAKNPMTFEWSSDDVGKVTVLLMPCRL